MSPDFPDPDDLTGDDAVRDRLSHVEGGDELTVHLDDGRSLAGEVRGVEETPAHDDQRPERELTLDFEGASYRVSFDPRASHGAPLDLYGLGEETFDDPVGEIEDVTVGEQSED